jgi:cell division protein FtsW
LLIATLLIIIGLLFIYSASSVLAFEKQGSSSYFLIKQLFGLGLGIVALIISRYFPFTLLVKIAPIAFIARLLLTILTLIPGFAHHIHGSSRWLAIGRFSFQPSELLKIGLILYISAFLTKKEFQKKIIFTLLSTIAARHRHYQPCVIKTA